MTSFLLADFKGFLVKYRDSWNSLIASRMAGHSSKELKVRWANSNAAISDWGYEEAEAGWQQACGLYEGKNPKWSFEDVLIEINQQQEGVVVFWATFMLDEKMTENKLLFVETFRKEKGDWKKIREYVENGFLREDEK